MFGFAPFVAPFAADCALLVAFWAGFFVLEAVVRLAVRFTGAEATDAAGILKIVGEIPFVRLSF